MRATTGHAAQHDEVAEVDHVLVRLRAEAEVLPRQGHEGEHGDRIPRDHRPAAAQAQHRQQHQAHRERVVLPRAQQPEDRRGQRPRPQRVPAAHDDDGGHGRPQQRRVEVAALEQEQPRAADCGHEQHDLADALRVPREPQQREARHEHRRDPEPGDVLLGEEVERHVLEPQDTRAVDRRVGEAAVVLGVHVEAPRRAVDALQRQDEVPELDDALRNADAAVDRRPEVGRARPDRPPGHEADDRRHGAHEPGERASEGEVDAPDEGGHHEDGQEHGGGGVGERQVAGGGGVRGVGPAAQHLQQGDRQQERR